MKIEIANEQNFPDLAKLRWEFKENNLNFKNDFIESYIDYLKHEDSLGRIKVFIAKHQDSIVGNINLVIVPKSPKPNSQNFKLGYITNVFIKKEFRNNGIGKKLINHIKAYSIKNFIELLIVWPSDESINFYKNNQFEDKNEIMEFCFYNES